MYKELFQCYSENEVVGILEILIILAFVLAWFSSMSVKTKSY